MEEKYSEPVEVEAELEGGGQEVSCPCCGEKMMISLSKVEDEEDEEEEEPVDEEAAEEEVGAASAVDKASAAMDLMDE